MTLTSVESPPEPEQQHQSRALDVVIKISGVFIAVVAVVLSGLLEIFLAPLRVGGVPIGVSVIAAVAGNYAIAWFAHTTAGRRWAVAPPWIVWTALMLFAAGVRTDEGDYLISGDNWVALVMILVGSLTFAVYAYRMILRPLPPVAIPKR